ncbi:MULTISPECIES: putative pilus assembly protein FilE [Acinetobacter]|uniref:putative pilus assembly protein FilE n=1 Tax=Acinetobacter TaxID=469 RepID=UPI0015B69523|nr:MULTISPECIES: putative pilus assembly protein FilE [Acinetobacter]MBT0885917.1 putative pilus assembly protein FilE [Acinetobacter towneri]NWJ91324.1 putative pilus assembly protein FilE [Acinetobacter sp. Swhac1]
MVSSVRKIKRTLFSKSILTLIFSMGSVCYANQFYTIIGPDGRPIVVQRNAAEKKQTIQALETAQKQKKEQQKPAQTAVQAVPAQQVIPATSLQLKSASENAAQKTLKEQIQETAPSSKVVVQQARTMQQQQKVLVTQDVEQSKPSLIAEKTDIASSTQKLVKASSVDVEKTKPKISSVIGLEENSASPLSQSAIVVEAKAETDATSSGFMEMAGEQYVKSEYLEDQEFNLEGKKRFYSMPEGVIDTKHGGGARMQVVERERGVSRSVLNKLFKKQSVAEPHAIVLAADYYRVNQAEAIEGLGQQCFAESKKNKAKTLKAQQDLNLWPRAPLTEKFDYELVKLEGNIQNIQINSYAMKQNQPTFYWPFVVFLDQKGCVIEGAGGFRNQDTAGNVLQHEVIEGMLQLPKNSHYVLLTPLASAVDMEHRALSNQGQLKLIAIR